MKQKYIVGDWVKFLSEKSKVIEVYEDSSYFMDSPNITGCPKEEELSPILLTPEILEKNGWDKDNSKFYEYDDDPEYENRYFNWTYNLTLDLDDCSVYKGTSGILYGLLSEVKYVHQLQHLLFGLGVNHDMEV